MTPTKYYTMIQTLADRELYSAAAVADWALQRGELNPGKERDRMRQALCRIARVNEFPKMGDGAVEISGQPLQRAWLGSRWKRAVSPTESSVH